MRRVNTHISKEKRKKIVQLRDNEKLPWKIITERLGISLSRATGIYSEEKGGKNG